MKGGRVGVEGKEAVGGLRDLGGRSGDRLDLRAHYRHDHILVSFRKYRIIA
jgi:hypothetical protein